ncbi:class I poly(R)-hydroxyalkanoic acid synthase [Roseomonas gilardii]|uniref:Class I poly(R)-hydroxyalkanoic acid synthase n=1 Tax=Roseomonas gilardii TaxID=257708 RepID=A0A1L7ADK8_9PROT|nr:class I poly(R)-hydroxyalkanoic acid synthase [Roseomonas gilardii]APT56878.1 class I poly(R)-hydroxyalkanoic acid synthase [Roseomonas gilardii]MDT8331047.1 class I poly(R)-hydroxyalkanoic acid synthase [Roseomonas gilardii]PZR10917.1 MAG: class I poly(R)-hydroxyalkanoic acid synthase [Azospirillum brasilense]
MSQSDKTPDPGFRLPDPALVTRTMADVAERSQRIVADFVRRQGDSAEKLAGRTGGTPQVEGGTPLDPFNLGGAFMEMASRLMANPARLMQAQMGFWQDYLTLWGNTARRMMGGEVKPVISEDSKDKRFKDDAWRENEVFDFIKQSYLLSARYMQNVVRGTEGELDPKNAQKVDFYTRQFVDAMSPTNFLMTNPQVLRRTAETGGENLLKGLTNLLTDLERGKGNLRISMTDRSKFAIGENIAVTPGKVVYRNELMELIQYSPTTEKVLKRPLLLLPPWINKFYILDLRPKNSLIRWAVSQGHTVFVCSWVNPDEHLAEKDFEDYMKEGPYAALDAIQQATGERNVNAIGYCLGGTLLAATLAHMAAKRDTRIKSATFFTTMTDFEEAGEISVFIDEVQLKAVEQKMGERGFLAGGEMANTFNMLRANDLIWSFVVQNYLLGQEPFPFDLLFWNDDSTRMPAKMHSFYLRRMYQQNDLVKPGGITLDGVPIDLRKIKIPVYLLSTREDHIAPWKSTYRATQIYGGPIRFVLAASGHIAGVVNAPESGKYSHWTNEALPADPEEWLEGATELAGSWWPDWQRWVTGLDNAMVPAREPGAGKLPALADAPGDYVKVMAQD